MAFAYGSVSYSFSYVYIDTSNLQNLLIFFIIIIFFNFKESESIEILLCITGRELWEHFSCSCSYTENKLGILFAAPWPDFYKSGVHAMQICFESWQGSIPNHLGAESICILWSKSIQWWILDYLILDSTSLVYIQNDICEYYFPIFKK